MDVALCQRGHTSCQEISKKMLNITNHQGNTKIQTIVRYHLTTIRMAVFKKIKDNNCWEGYGEKGTFVYLMGL